MKSKYNVDTELEPMSYTLWVLDGWDAVESAGRMFNTLVVKDGYGRPVLLFRNSFALTQSPDEDRCGREAGRAEPILNSTRVLMRANVGEKLGELSPLSVPPES
eukprot:gene29641-18280_t